MRMKKMKRTVFALMMMIFMLSGCSSTKLADAFDEETVKKTAQEAIDYMIAGEYEKTAAMMDSVMQEALPAESLGEVMGTMNGKTGAFREYKSIAVVGQQGAQGEDMAVVVLVAAFEKCNVTYTVSFDADMKIAGLWMK